jgi:hypothetical protein
MLAEERGRPLSVAIEGANVHDTKPEGKLSLGLVHFRTSSRSTRTRRCEEVRARSPAGNPGHPP